MDNTTRFDGKGDIYAKARPKYAAELFDYMKDELNIKENSVFADVGSGTGIFTEQLLNRGYKVFAVEPNADMRRKAEEKLCGNPNFTSVTGDSENTNLPDSSVEFVTAAQAFHWFDAQAFKKECGRILKHGGKVIIVYNRRDENAECTKAIAKLRRKYNSDFHGFSNGISTEKCIDFFGGKCDIFRADNTLIYDRQGYIDRALSSSYSLKKGDSGYKDYIKELNIIFDTYSENGYIKIPNETVAVSGSV